LRVWLSPRPFTPNPPNPTPYTLCVGEEALLEDELTEEEVLGELAPLTVLLAFVLISTGRPDDAVERLQPIIAGELPQREVAAIAANNWAVACFATGGVGAWGFGVALGFGLAPPEFKP